MAFLPGRGKKELPAWVEWSRSSSSTSVCRGSLATSSTRKSSPGAAPLEPGCASSAMAAELSGHFTARHAMPSAA